MVLILSMMLSVASADITYSQVESLVKENQITSVEGLLQALPDDYKNHYTLLQKSSALQGASVESPRAVVYGKTGELTLTFNSDPNLGGYDDVEFLAYDREQKEFELRVITFFEGKAIFSEKNPSQCTHCHGISPRPLWDNYPYWKHSYGAHSDILTAKEEEVIRSAMFREHPRFKAIIKKDADPLYPFIPSEGLGPNARLTKLYTHLQAEANIKRVLDSEGYKYSEKLALMALAKCELTPEKKRSLEDYYLLRIRELYPDQVANLEWWISKYTGESFYLTLLKSFYLFGMEYFQNNYFNLKLRYHEEHLSSDGEMSVREATLLRMASYINDPTLKKHVQEGDLKSFCKLTH